MSVRTQLVGATTITVGLSAVVTIPQDARVWRRQLLTPAGGSLFISQGAAASDIGVGADISTITRLPIEGPAQFYLSATGATTTVRLINEYTSGATFG